MASRLIARALPLLCWCLASASAVRVRRSLGSATAALSLLLSPAAPSLATLNDPEAMGRYLAARDELVSLDQNWDKVVAAGGDGIRRRLGTVYSPPACTSPLCSFNLFTDKFVSRHFDDIDYEAFEAPSAALIEALNQADFLAYSSVFADYGNGGGGVDYIANSRAQVERAISAIDKVIEVLRRGD